MPESLRTSTSDNGKGFDEASFNRFSNLLDRSDPQHKGIGRLVYLSYFSEIFVNSAFGMQRRHFIFNDEFDGDCTLKDLDEESYSTVIELTGYSKERIHKYDYISHDKLKHSIRNHFFKLFNSRIGRWWLNISFLHIIFQRVRIIPSNSKGKRRLVRVF